MLASASPKRNAATSSPRKDRESNVKHMLVLRAAGMLRRLHRAKLQEAAMAGQRSPRKERPSDVAGGDKKLAQKQQDLLVHEIDLWLAQKNSYNTTDKLTVPTDPELLSIAAKALNRFEAIKMPAPPQFDKATRAAPQPQPPASARLPTPQSKPKTPQENAANEPFTLPILSSPRTARTGKKIDLQAYTSHVQPEYNKSLIPAPPKNQGPIPSAVDAQPGLTEKHPNGYYATPGRTRNFTKEEEEQALRELEEEEARAMAKHKKGVKQKRQADLWAQLVAHEDEKFRAEEKMKKEQKKKQKQELLSHLEKQVLVKKSQQVEALQQEQQFLAKQELIRKEREQIQLEIENARVRRHDAEKAELMQQMREAELLHRKQELKAKLAEHQMKKAAELDIAREAARQQRKHDARAAEAITAVAQNEALKKIREENKRQEQQKELEQIEEFKRALDKQEAMRQAQLARIKEKQTRSARMSEALELSLDQKAAQDAQKAAEELRKINAKQESEAQKLAEERRLAKKELREALNDQMKEHRDREEQLRAEGRAEAEQVAREAEAVRQSQEEARLKRKDAIQKSKADMVGQITEKQARLQYEATRNMTDAERALNKRRLESLNTPSPARTQTSS